MRGYPRPELSLADCKAASPAADMISSGSADVGLGPP